jgi:uncharacterized membrane protein (DUF485 family)
VLALLIALGIVAAVATHSKVVYAIVASLFGSAVLVTVVAATEFPRWYSAPLFPAAIGWGLWLCLISAALGCVVAALYCVRLYRPRLAESS